MEENEGKVNPSSDNFGQDGSKYERSSSKPIVGGAKGAAKK